MQRNIPLHKVSTNDRAILRKLQSTFESGYIGQGPVVEEFERKLEEFFDCSRVVTVNSATSGLQLALEICRISGWNSVLTTPLTCMATTCAILQNWMYPIWVDIDPETLNPDPEDFRKKCEESDMAMVVHFAGRPFDIPEFDIPIVEDCAHAIGSELVKSRNLQVYSFQAVKPLTTGDGGAIIANDQYNYERLRKLRWYGIDRDDRESPITEAGYKFHMNDIAASIGISNMEILPDRLKVQKEAGGFYDRNLKEGGDLKKLKPDPRNSHYLYPILVDRREDFIRAMKDRGVECGIVHKRNDREPITVSYKAELPKFESIYPKIVCIPCGWWVGDQEREYIRDSIERGW